MKQWNEKLLSTTILPAVLVAGIGVGGVALVAAVNPAPAQAASACGACNPCNPCAASACNPCNPCATKACNPCNPCAAAACNPCNPCNPCAAAACNPCNPCNPCAGSAAATSNKCAVPRLMTASLCNPCAASACNPCNPCAAKACGACNPCNPCAAAACNPCNPCAAAACNPCNPCGGAAAAELTQAESVAVYDCLVPKMLASYAKSGHPTAKIYMTWRRYSISSYQSATHGARYVQNYANETARSYGNFEDAGQMPIGAKLAKDSFSAAGSGKVGVGPLFVMEKMPSGFNEDSGNWKYTMIMADGSLFGETNCKNSAGMQFCIDCHAAAADFDHLFFLPEELRVTAK